MKAARLYSAQDIRLDDIDEPAAPQTGEVVIKVKSVGVCGSDLHMYRDGRIGDTEYTSPLILGHEFAGEIIALGAHALDGTFQPLAVGQYVAVDPACPCYHCEWCERGHPNLCPNHTFYGVYPTDGALQECMIVKARNCFPMPPDMSFDDGALLEPLGVAIHAVDLGKVQVASSAAVIGCGAVGLLILRLLKLAGVHPLYAFDLFDWRVEQARAWGADFAYQVTDNEVVSIMNQQTKGRGVDTVFEAAWADHTIQQAAEIVTFGGKLVLVGIPGDDRLAMQHATARRKGLTIKMARRMKHTYPRAIKLAINGGVKLSDLVTHHFPLEDTAHAFQTNVAYETGLIKAVISD